MRQYFQKQLRSIDFPSIDHQFRTQDFPVEFFLDLKDGSPNLERLNIHIEAEAQFDGLSFHVLAQFVLEMRNLTSLEMGAGLTSKLSTEAFHNIAQHKSLEEIKIHTIRSEWTDPGACCGDNRARPPLLPAYLLEKSFSESRSFHIQLHKNQQSMV